MSLYGINRRLEAQKRIGFEMKYNVGTFELGLKNAKDAKSSCVRYTWYPIHTVHHYLMNEVKDSSYIWVLRYANRPVSPKIKYFDKFSYNYSLEYRGVQ